MRRLIPATYAFAASLAVASPCPGGDVDVASVSSYDPRVAPNKSISIDEAKPDPTAFQETASESRSAGDLQTETGETERTSPASARRRGAKQARLSRESARSSGDRNTPWYRTGIGALAIVLVLVAGATWVVRRWLPAARAGESTVLRVVARTSLSPKHNLALVRLGRRFLLIGVSGDRVNTLCEVNDPDEVAELAARTGTLAKLGAGDFDGQLLREVADYGGTAGSGAMERESTRGTSIRPREPLNDLLRKLRALQSK